jgi:pyruvate,orthophosphate dikinase
LGHKLYVIYSKWERWLGIGGVGLIEVTSSIRSGISERIDIHCMQVGVCGEHGGDPSSVAFFAQAGLDYVSCSPFRVPIARLAAAQAAAK